MKKVFVNQAYPGEGLIALRLFVRGKPTVVTIDDYLPFMGSSLVFARRSSDGDFWMGLLEKAFAKVNGNYENIGGGWQPESWRVLNGAPSKFYMMSSISYDSN